MDRIDPASPAPPAEPSLSDGVGSTFRAVATGTSIERRRRSVGATARAGRSLAADVAGDSGTWRLAL